MAIKPNEQFLNLLIWAQNLQRACLGYDIPYSINSALFGNVITFEVSICVDTKMAYYDFDSNAIQDALQEWERLRGDINKLLGRSQIARLVPKVI